MLLLGGIFNRFPSNGVAVPLFPEEIRWPKTIKSAISNTFEQGKIIDLTLLQDFLTVGTCAHGTPEIPHFCLILTFSARYHIFGAFLTSPDKLNMHREHILAKKMVLVACFGQQIFNLKSSLYGTNELNIYCIILYKNCSIGALSTRFNGHET